MDYQLWTMDYMQPAAVEQNINKSCSLEWLLYFYSLKFLWKINLLPVGLNC